jgi:hypothetical protein
MRSDHLAVVGICVMVGAGVWARAADGHASNVAPITRAKPLAFSLFKLNALFININLKCYYSDGSPTV